MKKTKRSHVGRFLNGDESDVCKPGLYSIF